VSGKSATIDWRVAHLRQWYELECLGIWITSMDARRMTQTDETSGSLPINCNGRTVLLHLHVRLS
jgi:hypothetical protein